MADIDLKKLDKNELEDLGRTFGIELDKRYTKGKLQKILKKHIDGLDKKDLELLGRKDGVELDRRRNKDTLVKELASGPDCGCGNTEDSQGKCDGSHAKQEQEQDSDIMPDGKSRKIMEEALRRDMTYAHVQAEYARKNT